MKKWLPIVGGMAAVAFLLAGPVQSEMLQVTDSELDTISGKKAHPVNTIDIGSDVSLTQGATGDQNIQIGYYQWHDKHTIDGSDHKGANDQSGATSVVQQNVTGRSNLIQWGSWATGAQDVGTALSLNQDATATASMALGGF